MTYSLQVLGCSSAIPTLTRNPSAHLLNANERLFLIDCAEGTQLQLRRYKIHFQRIRHIMISHLHGDHFYGLIGLLTSFHLLGRKEELHLYGPTDLWEIIDIQLKVSATKLVYPLVFHPLAMNTFDLIYDDDKITVHSFPVVHSVPTCGFVFREKKPERNSQTGPRSYAYCTDTLYTETIIPFIQNCSILYHEATFMKDMTQAAKDKFHSTTLEAATMAVKSGAKKLLIGHYSARYDDLFPLLEEAKRIFPETILAEDGLKINI